MVCGVSQDSADSSSAAMATARLDRSAVVMCIQDSFVPLRGRPALDRLETVRRGVRTTMPEATSKLQAPTLGTLSDRKLGVADRDKRGVGFTAPPMADDRLEIRVPPELKRAIQQEAERQGSSLTAFTIQALTVRLAWLAAFRAMDAGMTAEDAQDVGTIIDRLARVAAGQ